MADTTDVEHISVLVPKSPFVQPDLREVKHCLAALDVEKLMEWWPGKAHAPHRDPKKVRDIQRSLDWKRVAQIASYLLQAEILDAPSRLDKYFREIYEPKKLEPGRQWPPKVANVIGFERSAYPTFSNILLHVNGAEIRDRESGAATLVFDTKDKDLRLSVIDGQHRINGAYFALKIRHEKAPQEKLEIPAEVFLDLDHLGDPPKHQAQIFIDVNYYQKKVDRSLVADLFPTARGKREPLDNKERAQDIGRKLMLEVGPLVGMIQIPGIRFGVKDVVTLATLNAAIEDILDPMERASIASLEEQTEFLAQCLESWLEASGRKHDLTESEELDPENVAYQGRVLVSVITLLPACIWELKKTKTVLISDAAEDKLTKWFNALMDRAGLLKNRRFITKETFKERGYLGSGGIGRFRDTLWAAALSTTALGKKSDESRKQLAAAHKETVFSWLAKS